MATKKQKPEIRLQGIAVSEGIAIGSLCIYRTELDDIYTYSVDPAQISTELERYFSALNEVSMQFMAKQNRISRHIGTKQAEIYDAYRMILEDPVFQEEIPESIRNEKLNAETVIQKKLLIFEKQFESIDNDYLRERIFDIRGVSRRLIFNLMQMDSHCDFDRYTDNILVARELTPVDSIYFQHKHLKGIATEYGGKTSHAAILSHSLEIAAVVGVQGLMRNFDQINTAIIDGFKGQVVLDPRPATIKKYRVELAHWEAQKKRFRRSIDAPSPTISGRRIKLLSNINDEQEIELAQQYHAEGIGLYRTELQFIAKERFLTEDEQFEIYKRTLESFPDQDVVIRLLDMGGDKFLPFRQGVHELNPFLGWRSIRILLSDQDVLITQLRSLLRASKYGRLKILIPMISSMEELLEVKKIINKVKSQLKMTKAKVPVGIMIEVPSAALEIDKLLKEADFASIGTNDLVQYTLAVDRNNEKVASFYQPLNGAILYMIKKVADAGKKLKKEVSICGEMAGDPLYVLLLIALGLRNLSMHPAAIPRVKNLLIKTPDTVIKHLAKNYNKFITIEELKSYLKSHLRDIEENK